MTSTMRNWKRGTARFQGVEWQEGFFDHRLRTDEEANEKWHYIRRNPVVKNLCATEGDWPWWWSAMVPNPLLGGGAA
jgi:putative transposase